MPNQQEQTEAIRSAFRHYDLKQFLTPEVFSLVTDLELVDPTRNEIPCMGKCKNGGKCSRQVNKDDLVRGLMGLLPLVSSTQAVDEEHLHEVCKRFLCLTSKHRTDEQATRFCATALKIIQRIRSQCGAHFPVQVHTTVPPVIASPAVASTSSPVSAGLRGRIGVSMTEHEKVKQELYDVRNVVEQLWEVVGTLQSENWLLHTKVASLERVVSKQETKLQSIEVDNMGKDFSTHAYTCYTSANGVYEHKNKVASRSADPHPKGKEKAVMMPFEPSVGRSVKQCHRATVPDSRQKVIFMSKDADSYDDDSVLTPAASEVSSKGFEFSPNDYRVAGAWDSESDDE